MFSPVKRLIAAPLMASLAFAVAAPEARAGHHHHHHHHHGWHHGYGFPGGLSVAGGSASYTEAPQGEAVGHLVRLREKELDRKWNQQDQERSEQANAPSPEEQRLQAKAALLHRSLDPPKHEILSATAPNAILDDLQPFLQVSNGRGPRLPLDQDMLPRINVINAQDRSGNIAVLKNKGRLSWPSALRGAEYQEPRDALNALAPKAIKQAVDGGVQPETIRDMKDALGKLSGQLAANIKNLPPARHVESKRYLSELNEALRLLETPHAGNYFNGTFSAQGKTVADLIKYMSKQGLRFAPAVCGDEAAYENLHRALVIDDVAAHSSMTGKE